MAGAHGGVVVTAHGELDVATAPVLRETLMGALASQHRDKGDNPVVVDLSGLTFIDAAGLGVLVVAATRAGRGGGHIVLRHPTQMTVRLLEITGLLRVFPLERDDGGGSRVSAGRTGVGLAREVA